MELTNEQQEIIGTSQEMSGSDFLKIDACAGSGKTFTLAQIALANPEKHYLYLAFNKAIVMDAQKKFPSNVEIMTIHSLAWKSYFKSHKKRDCVSFIPVPDIRETLGCRDNPSAKILFEKYCDYLKSADIEINDREVEKMWHAVDYGDLPLIHDHYLKWYQLNEKFHKIEKDFDCVLLDEAQDTNEVVQYIFNNLSCEKILVGDSHQGIYGFNGAINALKLYNADINLNLTTCFRCDPVVVKQANFFLKRYADDRETYKPMVSGRNRSVHLETTAYLTRSNAGLIKYIDAFRDQTDDVKLLRRPKEIFDLPINILMLKMKKDLKPEFRYLESLGGDVKALRAYADEAKDVNLLCALNIEEKYGVELFELQKIAYSMGNSGDKAITLCTAHCSKGLEFGKVELSEDFPSLKEIDDDLRMLPKKFILNKEQQEYLQQELNLYYVGITRASEKLEDKTVNGAEYSSNKL